jgi:hypothetical protein
MKYLRYGDIHETLQAGSGIAGNGPRIDAIPPKVGVGLHDLDAGEDFLHDAKTVVPRLPQALPSESWLDDAAS